jgi:hypothetical protein
VDTATTKGGYYVTYSCKEGVPGHYTVRDCARTDGCSGRIPRGSCPSWIQLDDETVANTAPSPFPPSQPPLTRLQINPTQSTHPNHQATRVQPNGNVVNEVGAVYRLSTGTYNAYVLTDPRAADAAESQALRLDERASARDPTLRALSARGSVCGYGRMGGLLGW